MKKILTAAVAFMLLGVSASAQNKEGQKHREEGQKHKMHQELGLTDDQKAEMKRIREAEKNELEALKKDTKLTKEESIAARKAIHEKYKAQFKSVLTEEQQKKAVEMRDHEGDHEKRMKKDSSFSQIGAAPKNAKANRGDMRKGDDKKKMEEELNLTADQKSKIAASREEFKAQAEAIKKNDKLSKEQKQEAMRELTAKQRDEFKSILTEEQKEKMESKRKGEMKRNN